jgi:hypothetical protein
MRVHVLAAARPTNAGFCFLWPLMRFGAILRDSGLIVRILTDAGAPDLADCDILILEARAFGEMRNHAQATVLDFAEKLGRRVRVVWADNYDSTGQVFAEILPLVQGYWKSQILAEPNQYKTPFYGGRTFTDYYHREFHVSDDVPQYSATVTDDHLLGRMAVSWNMGLSDHGRLARWTEWLYRHSHQTVFARSPVGFESAASARNLPLSARFGASYGRRTIGFQRAELLRQLAGRISATRISRTAYRRELRTARAVLSPYGWGEICLRDFETLIAGAALVKPDMSHVATWPNWYLPRQTYLPVRWDLSDMDAVLDEIVTRPALAMEIAINGQEIYRQHTSGRDAAERFATHLVSLLKLTVAGTP